MKEEWRDVVGWEEYYEVSNQGRVRSKARMSRVNSVVPERKRKMGGIIRKQVSSGGYKFISLTGGERRATRPVHQLVLEAFVGPKPQGMLTRHLDSDPANNRLDNLKWDTQKNNMADRMAQGKYPIGEDHHMAKLTASGVRALRQFHDATGLEANIIAYALSPFVGVNPTCIYKALRYETWKNV